MSCSAGFRFIYQPLARSKAAHSLGWGLPNRQIITDLSRVSCLHLQALLHHWVRSPCHVGVLPTTMLTTCRTTQNEPRELGGFSWQAQCVPALRDLYNVHNSTLQPCHSYKFRWVGAGPCLWLLVIPLDDFNRSHQ